MKECPNCGTRIQKKALRCKYCKTMMKELLNLAGNELELYDSIQKIMKFLKIKKYCVDYNLMGTQNGTI